MSRIGPVDEIYVPEEDLEIIPIVVPPPPPVPVDPDPSGTVVGGSGGTDAAQSLRYARSGIVSMAWAQEPWRVLWCVRSDGMLLGCTYRRDQGVLAWHRHPMTNGAVEDVCVIPDPQTGKSQVWLAVQRMIGEETVRYIEMMTEVHEPVNSADTAAYNFLDSSLSYDGSPATVFSNLDHLEGETVQVWADGARHIPCLVTDGSITLTRAASVVHVGIHTAAYIQTLPAESGAANGTAQGKMKNVSRVRVRFVETMAGKIGRDLTKLDDALIRRASDPQGAGPTLRSGIFDLNMAGGFDREAQFYIVQDIPAPMTITALVPEIDGTDY